MEALECIKTRRSIRKFTEQPVTEDEVRQVVEAAAFAPSWKNTQIARYIVVTDKEKKDKLADNCMLGFAYNQKTTHGAPALVVLTMIKGRSGYERDGSFSTPLATHWQSFDAASPHRPSACPRMRSVSARSSWYLRSRRGCQGRGNPRGSGSGRAHRARSSGTGPAAPARKDVDTLLRFE